MKVKKLIEKLEKLNPNADVKCYNEYGNIEECQFVSDACKEFYDKEEDDYISEIEIYPEESEDPKDILTLSPADFYIGTLIDKNGNEVCEGEPYRYEVQLNVNLGPNYDR